MRRLGVAILLAGVAASALVFPASAKDEPARAPWSARQRAALVKAVWAVRHGRDVVEVLDGTLLESLVEISDVWPSDWATWTTLRDPKSRFAPDARSLLDLLRSHAWNESTEVEPWASILARIERGDATASAVPPSTPGIGPVESAAVTAARSNLRSISQAIDLYYLENRALPKSLKELTESGGKAQEPYVRSVPKDPWGEEYEYRVINVRTHEYRLSSAGPDRMMGTADDVVFPDDR